MFRTIQCDTITMTERRRRQLRTLEFGEYEANAKRWQATRGVRLVMKEMEGEIHNMRVIEFVVLLAYKRVWVYLYCKILKWLIKVKVLHSKPKHVGTKDMERSVIES